MDKFTCAAVYQVEAVCRTPLRTGGVDGDLQEVLRRQDGIAFVQGTSLAGALRGWLEQGQDAALSEALFGSQTRTGHLTVSDALFERDADQLTRPRLRIDPASAVGCDGGKFDVAHIAKGSSLHFSLVWQGTPEQRGELDAVEKLLGAMDAGFIRLGAQRSNGFGKLSLTVKRRLFDLTDPADRGAWLRDDWEGGPLTLPCVEDARQVTFTVTGTAGNFLVKGAPTVTEDGKTYTPNLSEGGTAVLPGSSVKGAVRARVEYIAKALGLEESVTERYFGRNAKDGDNGLPGLLRFEDVTLSGERKKISRIRIDRFTGGVQRQGLFTEEPLSTPLTLRIAAPAEPVPCGLLLYALRDLGLGLFDLGSGWAIGRGRVAVEQIAVHTPDGQQATLRFGEGDTITQEDPSGLFRAWLESLEEVRH